MNALRTRIVAGTAAASCVAVASGAHAGPIAAISAIFMAFYVACGVVIALALLALVLCRFIRDRQARALARLSIVLLVATPVPSLGSYGTSSFMPAFIACLAGAFSGGSRATGLFAHPILVAYAISFAAFVPLVLIWFRLDERYPRR